MGAVNDATKSPAPSLGADPPPATRSTQPIGEVAAPLPSSPPPPRRSERPSVRPGGPQSLIGTTLSGRYRIERLLGEGGMGAVYQAEHTHMRKRLAVKVLHPEMSRLPEVVARFEREAMAAAHIDHPNVAAATDFGKLEDGSFFLVLEYVEGKSLRDILMQGRLELGRALHVVRQTTAALGRAHALGIVHRDLKPENVMLISREGDDDFVKVLDFGIAKVPVGDFSAAAHPITSAQPALTQLGMVYGTPEYMAPEQALGQAVDARADLYSLGVITYEMLTGYRPFDHDSKVTLLGMHVTAPVPPMAKFAPDANIPPEVEALVAKLLAKDSNHRFTDAKDLVDAIGVALKHLAASGRIDAIFLDRALGASGGSGAMGPLSLRGSRASLAGDVNAVTAPHPAASARLKALGAEAMGSARTLVKRVTPRTWALVGGAAGSLIVLAVFISAIRGSRDETTTGTQPGEAGVVVPPHTDHSTSQPKTEEEIAAAETALDKKDYAGAISALAPLELAHPERADIHRDLERAYAATADIKNAMYEAELWLKADPAAAANATLGEDVKTAALGREDPDAAFALLETHMGSAGADILYDLAYGPASHGSVSSKARAALGIPEVRAHASAALAVTLDLRNATKCETEKSHLARARDAGDARTLGVLKSFQATGGCGFLGTRDCYLCMHRDGSLASAIEAVESRLAGP